MMALTLDDRANYTARQELTRRLQVAMVTSAISIQVEPQGTQSPTRWQKRVELAKLVLDEVASGGNGRCLTKFLWVCVTAAPGALNPPDLPTDQQIQNAVTANWDLVAGVVAGDLTP
jgi:hypothetical protein